MEKERSNHGFAGPLYGPILSPLSRRRPAPMDSRNTKLFQSIERGCRQQIRTILHQSNEPKPSPPSPVVAPSQTKSNQKNWGRPSEKMASTKMKYYQTNPFSNFQYRMLISCLRQFRTNSPRKNEPILSRDAIRRTAGLRPAAGSQPKRKQIANYVRILPFDVRSHVGEIRRSSFPLISPNPTKSRYKRNLMQPESGNFHILRPHNWKLVVGCSMFPMI
jgi:hypothetical protein